MTMLESGREPQKVPVEEHVFQIPPEVTFKGWMPEAFELLARLKDEPHIGQYRKERDSGRLGQFIKTPFKQYRDDIVLNWVLPSRLAFETESYVFSRLLKNDFGAGGCHHHKWMAFYRPNRKRLTDVQITHSLHPKGFDLGIFIGERMGELFEDAVANITRREDWYLELVNSLLADGNWRFYFEVGGAKEYLFKPVSELPAGLARAKGIWLRKRCPAEEIVGLDAQEQIVFSFNAIRQVYPVYRFYLTGGNKLNE